jgi:hypothetical protein
VKGENIMEIQLTPSLVLTDERAECRYGIPVLINRQDDATTYGPADVFQAYPSWGLQPAAHTVIRAFRTKQPCPFSADEIAAVRNFLGQWPDGPQL